MDRKVCHTTTTSYIKRSRIIIIVVLFNKVPLTFKMLCQVTFRRYEYILVMFFTKASELDGEIFLT